MVFSEIPLWVGIFVTRSGLKRLSFSSLPEGLEKEEALQLSKDQGFSVCSFLRSRNFPGQQVRQPLEPVCTQSRGTSLLLRSVSSSFPFSVGVETSQELFDLCEQDEDSQTCAFWKKTALASSHGQAWSRWSRSVYSTLSYERRGISIPGVFP